MYSQTRYGTPEQHLLRQHPDHPVMYFDPVILRQTMMRFRQGFPGLVTYAVKANPAQVVIENLVAAGIGAFDVASPAEIALVQGVTPGAVLHYNNPVRSPAEVATAIKAGVRSWSVDSFSELDKLGRARAKGEEVAVRLALPIKGAHYDFGTKFGTGPEGAVALLKEVTARGFRPAMAFHPGTQCADPAAWVSYVHACAAVAASAGVVLDRVNVGGGFASHRAGTPPDLGAIFTAITQARIEAFGQDMPALVCEPGRAMVAEAFTLATRVKGMRDCGAIFLNDGIYGAFCEARDICPNLRVRVISPNGRDRDGPRQERVVFGPTCDSLDRLPDPLALPSDLQDGDYLLFDGMGAYSLAIATRFNGYGPGEVVTLAR